MIFQYFFDGCVDMKLDNISAEFWAKPWSRNNFTKILKIQMDRLQSHIERVIPQHRTQMQPTFHIPPKNEHITIQETFRPKEIKNNPIMIAPSPVPTVSDV